MLSALFPLTIFPFHTFLTMPYITEYHQPRVKIKVENGLNEVYKENAVVCCSLSNNAASLSKMCLGIYSLIIRFMKYNPLAALMIVIHTRRRC